ncbi:FecCD family ABC transporter permease [Corynebacterium lowii]|uniref:Ferric enterobactin transport system permease protein FepG n=1 Tax=Corynebacterium lowii TaxID=1544413 RepID=A0A0Q1DV04_9CORY|nr:iron chelate uptake ABC transporter family permease subunit [Corynebacterium lowii]KQB83974.1 Ferric enterobactin transport system permease protein FepG [Corynebacterium lowii]MDP9852776.1 iron complex transport system permease protein [Corynebacterium lowii]
MSLNFGYRQAVIRTRHFSWRMGWRVLLTGLGLFALAAVLCVLSIGMGDFPLRPTEVLGVFGGEGTRIQRMIVLEWRLPIALAALLFGALLGLGGAIFQSLTRNPLGSPDVIGFDAGAYTAVTLTVLVAGAANYWSLAGAAVAGGLLTALAVYALAWRGGVASFRLIIVGIAVSAGLGSLNSYLITRAQVEDAMVVGFWAAGSLNRVTWQGLLPSLVLGTVVLVGVVLLAPALRALELGDATATTQGIAVRYAKPALMALGVITAALVTAAAGPIGFIALSAPQLAHRLSRSAGLSLWASAAMGAALLSAAYVASLVISRLFQPIPVGLITVCLGGAYMMWLLIRQVPRATSS